MDKNKRTSSRTRSVLTFTLLVLLNCQSGEPLRSETRSATLFPVDLPSREWRQFEADGYSARVCGVVYRSNAPPTNGMPVGGIDTGCLDLETDGLLGYCTLFNSHVPRRGPIGLPYLGVATDGKTWVLCKPRANAGQGLVSLSQWQLEPSLGPHQRLWAPGPASLPAWFKSVGELPYDIPAGRVACHSPAVLRWTSPADGELRIEGGLWLARKLDRPQRWELRNSQERLTSGSLEWGPTSQTPLSLAAGDGGEAALTTRVAAGDTLELIITNASTFGDYVGVDLKLTLGGRPWDVAADWSDGAIQTIVGLTMQPAGDLRPRDFLVRAARSCLRRISLTGGTIRLRIWSTRPPLPSRSACALVAFHTWRC